MFTPSSFVVRSLRFHRRLHVAVGLGAAVATAVLVGALLVGDSVRLSLRDLSLDRLGEIEAVLIGDHFFRQDLAAETSSHGAFPDGLHALQPFIRLSGSAETTDPETGATARRIGGTAVYGLPTDAWHANAKHIIAGEAFTDIPAGKVVLNAELANDLGVKPGDRITLRLPEITELPRDSALARKTDSVQGLVRLEVLAILGMGGWGRFELQPVQTEPRLAFLDLGYLQRRIEQYDAKTKEGYVNGILAAHRHGVDATPESLLTALAAALRPSADDCGLTFTPVPEHGYLLLSSRRMLLADEFVRAADVAFADRPRRPITTYLANRLDLGDKRIPYSTVCGIDFASGPPLGPFETVDGTPARPLAVGEVALLDWAAEDLGARVGDRITLSYFRPESTHGVTVEETATVTVRQIVKLTGRAADKRLTPDFPGITDQADILSWEPPFSPFHREWVRSPGKDEDYWDAHRAVPKAYVSLTQAKAWWGSRFGSVSGIRLPLPAGEPHAAVAELAAKLEKEIRPQAAGFAFRPVRAMQLAASAGSTPFDLLFLGFSMFIIAAALMLTAILFRLGIDYRLEELGILAAIGFPGRTLRRWPTVEGGIVALLGGVPGVLLGILYAAGMLWALRSPHFWLAAITNPVLYLHVTYRSLLIGYGAAVLTAVGVMAWSLRRIGRHSPRSLLDGRGEEPTLVARPDVARFRRRVAAGLLLLGLATAVLGMFLQGEAQAGAFFGSGAAVLFALLAAADAELRSPRSRGVDPVGTGLATLAERSLRRNPTRSLLTMGLTAFAAFLIVALSAFRIDPDQFAVAKNNGNGGFGWVAGTDLPLLVDPAYFDRPDVQDRLGLTQEEVVSLKGTEIQSLRVQPGDDASCLNLYQTNRPRLLGVPRRFVDRGGFAFSGMIAGNADERANPWRLLGRPLDPVDGVPQVPAILDDATAQYGLKVPLGGRLRMTDERGNPFDLVVSALLKNSTLQGDVLIDETLLLHHFPSRAGYLFFLLQPAAGQDAKVIELLTDRFGEFGFKAEKSRDRLERYLAVQNTYLLTFQSLGGLGLLLGTFGLAAVQLRNIFERRGELALMQAVGFPKPRLAALVLLESVGLLFGGLALGTGAALVALLPHLWTGTAAIPWGTLAASIGLVALAGPVAAAAAVRGLFVMPLLPALRGER